MTMPRRNSNTLKQPLDPQLNTYIQVAPKTDIKQTVLNDITYYNNKLGAILENLINARMFKKQQVDPEHNMLIAFDEGIQDRFLEDQDAHYLSSVSNYPTYLKLIKAAELTNANTKGELIPLNKDTITVLPKISQAFSIFYDALEVESKIKEAGQDMVLLGDGYTTAFKSNSPVSMMENFKNKKVLSNSQMQLGVRGVDPRRILLDPTAKKLQAGEFCAEEGRVTLSYVKQVLEKYYAKKPNMLENIYTQVRSSGQVPGQSNYITSEFLEDNGRYPATTETVQLYIYYEKRLETSEKSQTVVIDRYYIANERIIGYDSNIGTRYPYANWQAFPRRDTPYSQGYISKILPIQKVIDQIDAITLTIGIQTATPSMVVNDEILGDYTDEELAEIYTAGNIFRGKLRGGITQNQINALFLSPQIPQQLLVLRDKLEQDQLKILNITPISQGESGSLQKTGAVEQVIAETKKVDKFSLDTTGLRYFKQLQHMVMELLISVVGDTDEEIIVPSITDPLGYVSLELTKADLTNIAYDFKFNIDVSSRDKQANDEAILKELLEVDLQYGKDEPIRIILPEELLKASSLSPDIKAAIIERINEDRKKVDKILAEQQAKPVQQPQVPQQQLPPQGQFPQQAPLPLPQQAPQPGNPEALDILSSGGLTPDMLNNLPPEILDILLGGGAVPSGGQQGLPGLPTGGPVPNLGGLQ